MSWFHVSLRTTLLVLLSLCKDLYFTTFDARLYAAGWGEKEILRVKDVVLWDREPSAVMHFLFSSFECQRTPKPELPFTFPSSSYPAFLLPGSTYWLPLFWIMVTHCLRYIASENCSLLFFPHYLCWVLLPNILEVSQLFSAAVLAFGIVKERLHFAAKCEQFAWHLPNAEFFRICHVWLKCGV